MRPPLSRHYIHSSDTSMTLVRKCVVWQYENIAVLQNLPVACHQCPDIRIVVCWIFLINGLSQSSRDIASTLQTVSSIQFPNNLCRYIREFNTSFCFQFCATAHYVHWEKIPWHTSRTSAAKRNMKLIIVCYYSVTIYNYTYLVCKLALSRSLLGIRTMLYISHTHTQHNAVRALNCFEVIIVF